MSLVDYGHRSVPNVFLTAPLETTNAKTGTGTWNAAHFDNSQYDSLVAQYIAAIDLSTQRSLAGQIETLLLAQTPIIYGYFYNYLTATAKNVTGVVPDRDRASFPVQRGQELGRKRARFLGAARRTACAPRRRGKAIRMATENRAHADAHEHDFGHHHRDVSGGWLRPAVFGAMDGLVTNVSLIAGVGGGGAGAHTIVLTGLAGLAAGAFSMAAGEYVSVSSQNELIHAEVDKERLELEHNAAAEQAELAAHAPRPRRQRRHRTAGGRGDLGAAGEGAGRARAGGTRHRPRRAAVAPGGGGRVAGLVRGRGADPAAPLPVSAWTCSVSRSGWRPSPRWRAAAWWPG